MSLSPGDAQLDGEDKQSIDQLDEQQPSGDTEGEGTAQDLQTPVKRGRGRPKGSKNKQSGTAMSTANAEASAQTGPRKRGRPPKEKKDIPNAEGSAPRRKRGRPPKNPRPEGEESGNGDAAEPPLKKKRGRPSSKKASE